MRSFSSWATISKSSQKEENFVYMCSAQVGNAPPPPDRDPPAGVRLGSRTSPPYFGFENRPKKRFGVHWRHR